MNISELYHSITQKYDLFICFNSFEKRCVSIASHLPIDKFAAALILTNKVHLENEEENLQKLSSLFSEKGTVVQLIKARVRSLKTPQIHFCAAF